MSKGFCPLPVGETICGMILILSELECKVIKVFDSSPLGKESVPGFFILPRLGNKVRQGFQILPLGNKLSTRFLHLELS